MSFKLSKSLIMIDILLNIIGSICVVYAVYNNIFVGNMQTVIFICIFAAISLIFSILELRFILFSFLVGLFAVLVTLRLGALNDSHYIMLFYSLIFSIKCLSFINIIINDFNTNKNVILNWQLIFIRMYIGLDLINHSVEKLFAGTTVRNEDVQYFTSIGIHNPLFLVIIAGLCEFFGAIGVGLGAFTRLACAGTALYLFISTILGRHFHFGFIWASAGGGYEYPILWLLLILSFIFTGGQKFSIDGCLRSVINKNKLSYNGIFFKIIKLFTK